MKLYRGGFSRLMVLAGLIFCLLLICSETAGVHAQDQQEDVTLSAQAGFDGYCKKGEWIPIQVTVGNNGPDIDARVQVAYRDKVFYGSDLLLPATSNKRLFLYVYDQGFTRNLTVSLNNGKKTLTQVDLSVACLSGSDILVGLVVDNPSAYTILTDIPLEGGSVRLAQLKPVDLPDQAQGWAGLDALVVSGLDTGKLSDAQKRALHTWLTTGGKLFVGGGPNWQRATAGLDGVLPLELNDTRTIKTLSGLQGYSEIPLPEDFEAILATGRIYPDTEVLAEQAGVPLVASRSIGLGTVFLLALDPGMQPLNRWGGMLDVYGKLLELENPSVAWNDGTWESGSANRALSTLSGLGLPSFLYICGWLGLYVSVIGPVNYLVLRRLKRGELGWLTTPVIVLVFTLIAYLSGFAFRGRQPVLNRLAVIQSWEGSEAARVNALVGLYSPKRAKYSLGVEDNFKFYPFEGDSAGFSGTWHSLQDGPQTHLADVQVEIGGVQAVALEGYLPAMTLDHNLVLTLSSKSPVLAGTITNTNAFTLRDALLVTSIGVQPLGDLPPNVPQEVKVTFITGNSGSPYYFLDNNDIRGHYYSYGSDEVARRRDAMLDAVLYSESVESIPTWGIYLMGWIEEPMLPVSLLDHAFQAVDTNFAITGLLPTIAPEGSSLYLPPSMFTWENEQVWNDGYGTPYSTGVSTFPTGGYTTYFRPAFPLQFKSVQSLSLNIQATETPDNFTVSLWDYEKEDWHLLEIANWGSLSIPEPWRYVGPENRIGLNIDSDLEDTWVEIEPSNFSLEVGR